MEKLIYSLALLFFSFSLVAQKPKVIIDADTGNEIDDLYAIVHAFKSGKLDIIGLTGSQWKHVTSCDSNTIEINWQLNNDLLNLLDRTNTPNLRGSEMMVGRPWGGKEPRPSEATDFIIEKALEMPKGEKLVLISLGAVTNVASAILLEPEIIDKIDFYHMGGKYDFDKKVWNKNTFNINGDRNGYDVILDTEGLNTYILPASVARHIIFDRDSTTSSFNLDTPLESYLMDRWNSFAPPEYDKWIMWDIGIIDAVAFPERHTSIKVTTPPENTRRTITVYKEIDIPAIKNQFWSSLE